MGAGIFKGVYSYSSSFHGFGEGSNSAFNDLISKRADINSCIIKWAKLLASDFF